MKTLSCWMKILATLLAFTLFPLMTTAQEMTTSEVKDTIKQIASADKMETVTVVGVVNEVENQLMLDTDTESYVLDTQVDEAMIGQKVIATGVVVNDNGVKRFKPQSIKVAQ